MACGREPSQAPFVLYSCLTVLFGVLNGVTGPVLLELEGQVEVDSAGIGAVFLYRGAGSMAGGLLVGFVLDAVNDPHSVLVALLAVKAIAELSMPFSRSLAALGAQFCVIAFCANATSTVGSTCVAWTYGKLMGPQMNVLNAVFGIGACLAPLLAAACRLAYSRAVFSYWVVAALDALFIAAALTVPATENPRLADKQHTQVEAEAPPVCTASAGYVKLGEGAEEPEAAVDLLAIALCCASVLFAGVCETAIIFWLFAYSTEQLRLTAALAGTLNTLFFAAFTAARFFWGWLITFVRAESILKWSLAVCILASLALVCPSCGPLLPCLGMIGVGVGISPFPANAPVVLRQKTFITGRAQGSVRMAGALGAMIGASGTGFLQKWDAVGGAAMPTMVILGVVAELAVTTAFLRRCGQA